MKKRILLLLFVSTLSNIYGLDYTNKTFLASRAISTLQYMQHLSFHRLLNESKTLENPIGGSLQITRFYRESTNKTELGKYFGVNRKNKITYGNATNYNLAGSTEDRIPTSKDIDRHWLIHRDDYFNSNADTLARGPSELAGTLTLRPKHTASGFLITYHHSLDTSNEKLFFKINVPVLTVKNDLNATVTEIKDLRLDKGILDYLSGNIDLSNTTTLQYPLQYAKIDGEKRKSGLGDITLSVGYKFVEKEDYQFNANLNFILPTGSKANGRNLFEPILGNGKHVGVGIDIATSLNIHRDDNFCIELLINGNVTRYFRGTEKRTLGFRNSLLTYEDPTSWGIGDLDNLELYDADGDTVTTPTDAYGATFYFPTPLGIETTMATLPWSYYFLGGKQDEKGVFPLANVLTQNVHVSPGASWNGSIGIAYHNKSCTFDVGYSFFSKDGEKITLKETWQSDTYAPISVTYNPEEAFNIMQHGDVGWNYDYLMSEGLAIKKEDLDTNTPATPAIFTQTIYFGASFIFAKFDYPLMVGIGGSYELANDNSAIEGFNLWGKIGLTF